MSQFYAVAASLLLVTLVLGILRVLIGPTQPDRMVSAQLFGTTGVATLLLLAYATQTWPIIDVALVVALLAAVAIIAFVRRVRQPLRPRP